MCKHCEHPPQSPDKTTRAGHLINLGKFILQVTQTLVQALRFFGGC